TQRRTTTYATVGSLPVPVPVRRAAAASDDPEGTMHSSPRATMTTNDPDREAPPAATGLTAALVKPLMRGWIHLATTPLALVAGLVLVAASPTLAGRLSAAVFALAAVVLFGTSAVYHRGSWSPRWAGVLRRADHSN